MSSKHWALVLSGALIASPLSPSFATDPDFAGRYGGGTEVPRGSSDLGRPAESRSAELPRGRYENNRPAGGQGTNPGVNAAQTRLFESGRPADVYESNPNSFSLVGTRAGGNAAAMTPAGRVEVANFAASNPRDPENLAALTQVVAVQLAKGESVKPEHAAILAQAAAPENRQTAEVHSNRNAAASDTPVATVSAILTAVNERGGTVTREEKGQLLDIAAHSSFQPRVNSGGSLVSVGASLPTLASLAPRTAPPAVAAAPAAGVAAQVTRTQQTPSVVGNGQPAAPRTAVAGAPSVVGNYPVINAPVANAQPSAPRATAGGSPALGQPPVSAPWQSAPPAPSQTETNRAYYGGSVVTPVPATQQNPTPTTQFSLAASPVAVGSANLPANTATVPLRVTMVDGGGNRSTVNVTATLSRPEGPPPSSQGTGQVVTFRVPEGSRVEAVQLGTQHTGSGWVAPSGAPGQTAALHPVEDVGTFRDALETGKSVEVLEGRPVIVAGTPPAIGRESITMVRGLVAAVPRNTAVTQPGSAAPSQAPAAAAAPSIPRQMFNSVGVLMNKANTAVRPVTGALVEKMSSIRDWLQR